MVHVAHHTGKGKLLNDPWKSSLFQLFWRLHDAEADDDDDDADDDDDDAEDDDDEADDDVLRFFLTPCFRDSYWDSYSEPNGPTVTSSPAPPSLQSRTRRVRSGHGEMPRMPKETKCRLLVAKILAI